MRRKARWSVLVGCLVMASVMIAGAAFANKDIPRGKWWRFPYVVDNLNIDDSEKAQLDKLYAESQRAMIDLKAQMEKQRFELDNLMSAEPLDETAVMEQFKKLETARAALTEEKFRFVIEARKLLGYERYQQLKSIYQDMRDQRHQAIKEQKDDAK